MSELPLAGRRVLVTRAVHQAGKRAKGSFAGRGGYRSAGY